jgi:hypothetical protein
LCGVSFDELLRRASLFRVNLTEGPEPFRAEEAKAVGLLLLVAQGAQS